LNLNLRRACREVQAELDPKKGEMMAKMGIPVSFIILYLLFIYSGELYYIIFIIHLFR